MDRFRQASPRGTTDSSSGLAKKLTAVLLRTRPDHQAATAATEATLIAAWNRRKGRQIPYLVLNPGIGRSMFSMKMPLRADGPRNAFPRC